jgi:hypothetical protein
MVDEEQHMSGQTIAHDFHEAGEIICYLNSDVNQELKVQFSTAQR